MMRFEFYGARALNNQLNSGKKYRDLKPVYQIIFIDEYAWNNRNLINQYQMRNEQEKLSAHPSHLYIHMPAINDIVREKEIQRLNDFEQLVYLFENNGKMIYWSQRKGWWRYSWIRRGNAEGWRAVVSTAMAIQMGEARYRYGLEDSFEEGKIEGEKIGIQKGRISLLLKLLKSKYHDCSAWLLSLNDEQMEAVSSLILVCNSFRSWRIRLR